MCRTRRRSRLVVHARAQVDVQHVYVGVLRRDRGECLVDDRPSGHVVVVDVLAREELQVRQFRAGADSRDQVAVLQYFSGDPDRCEFRIFFLQSVASPANW